MAAAALIEDALELELTGDQGILELDTGGGGGRELVPTGEPAPFDKRLAAGDVAGLLVPFKTMSRIRVSIGVLPTNRRKKTCSMTCEDTVLKEGSRKRSLPNLVGWFGYCVRQYSSSAH